MRWRPLDDVLALVELAAPSACAGCGRGGTRWCDGCQAVLTGTGPRAWRPTPCPPGLPPTWAGPEYDGVVRAALVAWKEQDRVDLTPLLAEVLARVLATALTGSPPHDRAVAEGAPVALVPAPSARSSTRSRGRAPVRELARAATRPQAVVDALRLRRRVRDQAGLHADERARNLAGAVEVTHRARALHGIPCVLVDDVVTTGATLQECARALREVGAGPVVAVTVAATARRSRAAGTVVAPEPRTPLPPGSVAD